MNQDRNPLERQLQAVKQAWQSPSGECTEHAHSPPGGGGGGGVMANTPVMHANGHNATQQEKAATKPSKHMRSARSKTNHKNMDG